MPIEKTYTAMIRKSRLEYVAICLEINVSARGVDIPEVEKNLKNAINEYLEYIIEAPETEVAPLSTEELIEFLKDTEPAWYRKPPAGFPLKPFEVHEVPVYV
ncbi:MAG: hypothetical protein AAGB97_03470 [Dehalococcoidia bacterium]